MDAARNALERLSLAGLIKDMAEAYERKRLEALDWLQDPGGQLRAFAAKYIADLESMRDSERARADESIALRKFEYGEE